MPREMDRKFPEHPLRELTLQLVAFLLEEVRRGRGVDAVCSAESSVVPVLQVVRGRR